MSPRGGTVFSIGRPHARRGPIALATAVMALAIGAPVALATTDRSDYAAQVNPICVSASTKVQPLVDKHTPKATKRGLAILRRELKSLSKVAPAPGDQALVASWLNTRRSIQSLVERDVAIAARLQRLEDKYFNGKRPSGAGLKEALRRVGNLGRTINRIEGRVSQESDTESSLAFTLGALDCIGSIGPEELLEG